jgi:hypothetical protein
VQAGCAGSGSRAGAGSGSGCAGSGSGSGCAGSAARAPPPRPLRHAPVHVSWARNTFFRVGSGLRSLEAASAEGVPIKKKTTCLMECKAAVAQDG